ncbi:DUF2922 domain-containing protein [Heliorestis convoluta]|uniref:DUF2922 domain-containing protein n=1 Tax=Heliorestis convoluta TaxID=356322 RepID=A0A5Q2N0X9_9FIRM|nr:DUF2922 domain-containing protein [Heliorestis convoluta]QGG47211.1 hypothetical protein FTV88_1059 [Heliorestis convoluta]QGG47216.1 hypothetical protein FTV88_1064 [Heliorestis convoluta]
MSITRNTLELVFSNQLGRDVTLRIRDPKTDVTTEEILTVMDGIIAKNIINSTGGDLVNKKDVRFLTTTIEDLYDPA